MFGALKTLQNFNDSSYNIIYVYKRLIGKLFKDEKCDRDSTSIHIIVLDIYDIKNIYYICPPSPQNCTLKLD